MLGSDLRGKQLGIVGFGRIGRAVAAARRGVRHAGGLHARRARRPGEAAEAMPLDRLLATSDVVSLHCPLTPETRHLIDQPALARMKRSAYLINASRGPIVDEAALAWALKNRLIAGAGLDVYEQEPTVHPDLLALENVVLVAAPGQRDHRDAHRHGRSGRAERRRRADRAAAADAGRAADVARRAAADAIALRRRAPCARWRGPSPAWSCRRSRRSPRARPRTRSRS